MKKILIITVFLWPFLAVAQKNIVLKPMSIGDKVPDVELSFNSPLNKSKLSDFKGKLVIFDFWYTTCSTCIELWPKMAALQAKFKDQIQIILVNGLSYDTPERLMAFYSARNKKGMYDPGLPRIDQAFDLAKLFPHQGAPHIGWIDQEGKVIAISDSRYVTPANIKLALAGKLSIPIKLDVKYDSEKPLFVDGNGGYGSKFLYRSLITNPIPGFLGAVGSARRNERGEITRYHVNRRSVLDLFLEAYQDEVETSLIYNSRNIDAVLIDSNYLKRPDDFRFYDTEWKYKYEFNYEVVAERGIKKLDLHALMRKELEVFFKIDSKIEKRDTTCLVLKKVNGANLNLEYNPERNIYVSNVVLALNKNEKLPIVILDTKDDISVIPIAKNELNDYPSLKVKLRTFGYELIEEKRSINFLILRDKTPSTSIK